MPTLQSLIVTNREELVARARSRLLKRSSPARGNLDTLVPYILATLSWRFGTLNVEGAGTVLPAPDPRAYESYLSTDGLTITQIVDDYRDVCNVVMELAAERSAPITSDELCTLHRCLEHAIALDLTAYTARREAVILQNEIERSGVFAHELRNELATAVLSFESIKQSIAEPGIKAGAMHTRSLGRLRELIDRSLVETRLDARVVTLVPVVVAELLEEPAAHAAMEAHTRGLSLSISPVDPAIVVDVDRHLITSALTNVLQNALKFTRPHSLISLITRATATHVYILVEDQCGGLPANAEHFFQPFEQHSTDRSGVGLGLLIARRAVEANGGHLQVLDLAPRGCRFTIELPRSPQRSQWAPQGPGAAANHEA
jgi:signal transduction histidine kinase